MCLKYQRSSNLRVKNLQHPHGRHGHDGCHDLDGRHGHSSHVDHGGHGHDDHTAYLM